jgi:double-stranded uracil-DNA glycosylase
MTVIEGFLPIARENALILILGSMPSEISLQKQQYYGHPRNAFWPIMGELFGAYPALAYAQRQQILINQRVAVWDVLRTCVRKGSLDADIGKESMQINSFIDFFARHASVQQVFFNGGMAEKVYNQQVLPHLAERFDYLQYRRLPSTSPAYATMNLQQKIIAWKVIKE